MLVGQVWEQGAPAAMRKTADIWWSTSSSYGVYLVLVSMEELSVMTPVRTLVKWSTMPKRNGEMGAEKKDKLSQS